MEVVHRITFVCLDRGLVFFYQAEDGIRDLVRSRGLGDVYKRQVLAVLLAVGLAERRRFDLALVALTAGALVKFVPLLILPLVVVTAVRRLGWRRAGGQLGLGLVLSLLLAWLCYRPFWPLTDPLRLAPVSYTHLPLPTSDLV